MIVHHLTLHHFRNYSTLDVNFSPTINVIYGDNAQGKTNLIEAIAYLSACRSHRARWDRELIAFDQPEAEILCPLSLDILINPDVSPEDEGASQMKMLYCSCPSEMRETLLRHTQETAKELTELSEKFETN